MQSNTNQNHTLKSHTMNEIHTAITHNDIQTEITAWKTRWNHKQWNTLKSQTMKYILKSHTMKYILKSHTMKYILKSHTMKYILKSHMGTLLILRHCAWKIKFKAHLHVSLKHTKLTDTQTNKLGWYSDWDSVSVYPTINYRRAGNNPKVTLG